MNVLQRQMFKVGGPSVSAPLNFQQARDIIIQERERRGLKNYGGLNPEIVRQAALLQQGVNLERIFTPGGLDTDENLMAPMGATEQPQQQGLETLAPSEQLAISDPTLKTFTPSLDPIAQIRYYAQQGYNAVDIKELIPSVDFSTIERIVAEEGGILNTAVRGPESFEQAPDVLREGIAETIVGRDPSMLRREIPVDPIQAGLESLTGVISAPEMDIGDISAPVGVDLLNVNPELQPNQYRTSAGNIVTIDNLDDFRNNIEQESSRILSALIGNPNVEYGSGLASIIEDVGRRRASTLVDPRSIQVGQEPILGIADIYQRGLKMTTDFGKELVEDVFNLGRAVGGSPTLRGIFAGSEAEERARQSGAGSYQEIFKTGLPSEAGVSEIFSQEYRRMGGEKPETLDRIVLQAGGVKKEDEINKALEELVEKQTVTTVEDGKIVEEVKTDEVVTPAGEEVVETEVTKEGERPVNKELDEKIKNKGAASLRVEDVEDPDEDVRKFATGFFNSPEFLDYVTSLSMAGASSKDLSEMIAKGSALAAKTRKEDIEAAKLLEGELLKEKIKKSGPRDASLIKAIRDAKIGVSDNYNQYKEAKSTQNLSNIVLDFLNTGDITSFAARLGVGVDRILTLVGKGAINIEDQSPRGIAQNALIILKQRNIKAILNESSRTISDTDRRIADKIAGSLEDFDITTPGALKQKLQETLRSATESANQSKRAALAEYGLLEETGDDRGFDKEIIDFLNSAIDPSYVPEFESSGFDTSGIQIIDLVPTK